MVVHHPTEQCNVPLLRSPFRGHLHARHHSVPAGRRQREFLPLLVVLCLQATYHEISEQTPEQLEASTDHLLAVVAVHIMFEVDYQVKEVDTEGKQRGDVEWLKRSVEGRCWEVEGESVSLLLTFPEGKIHEIHLGFLSSLAYTVEAGTDTSSSDLLTIYEGREHLSSKTIRMTRNTITEVRFSQYQDFRFSRARVNFQVLGEEKVLRLGYFGLFRKGLEGEVPPAASVRYSNPGREEPRDTYIPPKKVKRQVEGRPVSPERKVKIPQMKTPTNTNGAGKKGFVTPAAVKTPNTAVSNRTTTTRPHRKAPIVCSDPPESSYSTLLQNCVISYLSDPDRPNLAEHVSKLCECMGALYLDHLSDITTHVVLPPDLTYDERALRTTTAKLVSVRWLETCLDEKVRQREESFEVL